MMNEAHRKTHKIGAVLVRMSFVIYMLAVTYFLVADQWIILKGQIGGITIVLYYLVFLFCSCLFWGGRYLNNYSSRTGVMIFTSTWRAMIIWLMLGCGPLFLPIYGYGGPN
jgi:F0F1-type ATP synthase assembly protein I